MVIHTFGGAARLSKGPGLVLMVFMAMAGQLLVPGYSTADMPAEMGSGAAWLDCDNDGDLDILYLDPNGSVTLLEHNLLGNSFTDITNSAIPLAGQFNRPLQGVACGDLTGDGFADIFLTADGSNSLLINNRDGSFKNITRTAGIAGEALSSSVALLDYNLDGRLDIYIANYMGMANQFYRNDGVDAEGIPHFTDVAPELGMDLAPEGMSNWSLGLAVADYDNDGDVDLYLANDYNGMKGGVGLTAGPNVLYRNEGDGTFSNVSLESGAADPGWAMGVAFGDYDNDGWQDLFITNFWEDALLKNNRDGTFSNVTRAVGLITDAPDEWYHNGWGTAFIDYDNDGDLDIHVSNGYILNDQGQIEIEPNQLWENRGETGRYEFREVGARAGVADVGKARGAAYADYNRDGLIDMLVINNEWLAGEGGVISPHRMLYVNQGDGTFRDQGYLYRIRDQVSDAEKPPGYRNYKQNSWVQVKPVGTESNRDAIGTRVRVRVGSSYQIKDLGAGSYCSQSDPALHFGLGNADRVDEIYVRFPSGKVRLYRNVPVNQLYTVTEPQFTPVELLSFDMSSMTEGVSIRWRYSDDGDLLSFSLWRETEGLSVNLASGIRGEQGQAEFFDSDAPVGPALTYTLFVHTRDGGREILHTEVFRHLVVKPLLGQNFPNPFSTFTAIPVAAPGGSGDLLVLDVTGRLVRLLHAPESSSGGVVRWDGRDASGRLLPEGVYFYRFASADDAKPLKMILRR